MTARATLLRHADVVLTMDGTELKDADIRIEGGVISELGQGLRIDGADTLDVSGCVVTPGLVNTHHHLFQTLTRAVPKGQDALLFGWLQTLYPIWARMGPEDMRCSATLGLTGLALRRRLRA